MTGVYAHHILHTANEYAAIIASCSIAPSMDILCSPVKYPPSKYTIWDYCVLFD